ncbi:MAG: hypothetical protein LBR65_08695 [Culturomica sp.]|jgi:predicted aspartyl protease|nr:hypothetical protein [Culturomica sp.]
MRTFTTNAVIAILILTTSCSTKPNTNRAWFDPEETWNVVIPVSIGDSISAKMFFDTGCQYGYLMLDSTFCAETNLLASIKESGIRTPYYLSAFAAHNPAYTRSAREYKNPIILNIGSNNVWYKPFRILDSRRDFAIKVDGMAGFPKNDTTRVWELNFSHNYLEIHPATDFKMPENCYVLPLIEGPRPNLPHVRFPIKITSSNGDTITIHETYLVDTGLTQDMVLTPNSKAFAFFDKLDDALLVTTAAGYRSRYIVGAEVFDNTTIDSLRIYTDQFAEVLIRAGTKGILGLNFLKRFNLFFDFKNKLLGFQPTGKPFERAVNPNVTRFYYSASFTKDQRYIVTMVADIVENPLKEAGLLVGDEITGWDGVSLKELLAGYRAEEKEKRTVHVLDIIRNGEAMQLTWQSIDDGWAGD